MDANGNDVKNVGTHSSVETKLDKNNTPTVRLETSSGGTDINEQTLFPWDSAPLIDTGTFSYTSGNDYVYVDSAGTYEVQANLVFDDATDYEAPAGQLCKNRTVGNGSGGTELSAVGQTGYIRGADGHEESSLHISWIGDLSVDDTIGIQMRREAKDGTCYPTTGETNMYVKKIGRP